MIQSEQVVEVQKFAGLFTAVAPHRIPDEACVQLINCIIGDSGELTKRAGFDDHSLGGGTDLSVHIISTFKDGTTNLTYVAVKDSSTWTYRVSVNSGAWTDVTGIPNTAVPTCAAKYGTKIYIGTEANGIYVIQLATSNTSASAVASSPNVIQLVVWKDRMWGILINNPAHRVVYTDVAAVGGYPETWGSNSLNIDEGSFETRVNRLEIFQDRMLIFKNNSIWTLYYASDPAFWNLKVLTSQYGCDSSLAVAQYNNLLYFIDVKGVYATDGVVFKEVSAPIRDKFRGRTNLIRVASHRTDIMDSLCVWENQLICCIRTSNTFNEVFLFRMESPQGWSGWTIVPGGALQQSLIEFVYRPSCTDSIDRELWVFSKTETYKYTPGIYDDVNGAAFQVVVMYMTTKLFDFGERTRIKRNKYNYLFLTPPPDVTDTVQITYAVDNVKKTPFTVTYDTADLYADPSSVQPYSQGFKIKGAEYFRTLQLYYVDDTSDALTLDGYSLVIGAPDRNVPDTER